MARNMFILFYELSVCGRDTKIEKAYLKILDRRMVKAMFDS